MNDHAQNNKIVVNASGKHPRTFIFPITNNMDNQHLSNQCETVNNTNASYQVDHQSDYKLLKNCNRLNYEQKSTLEEEFSKSKKIDRKRKTQLANNLKITERQVKHWFQNRRAKDRKKIPCINSQSGKSVSPATSDTLVDSSSSSSLGKSYFSNLPMQNCEQSFSILDNKQSKKSIRIKYTIEQRCTLEEVFSKSKIIDRARKSQLANNLKITERQVKLWFMNRRKKDRMEISCNNVEDGKSVSPVTSDTFIDLTLDDSSSSSSSLGKSDFNNLPVQNSATVQPSLVHLQLIVTPISNSQSMSYSNNNWVQNNIQPMNQFDIYNSHQYVSAMPTYYENQLYYYTPTPLQTPPNNGPGK